MGEGMVLSDQTIDRIRDESCDWGWREIRGGSFAVSDIVVFESTTPDEARGRVRVSRGECP